MRRLWRILYDFKGLPIRSLWYFSLITQKGRTATTLGCNKILIKLSYTFLVIFSIILFDEPTT